MQQRRNLSRGTAIMAAVVTVVLAIGAFTISNKPAEASVAQSSIFGSFYQQTQNANSESRQQDKTKEPKDNTKITICHVPPGNPENAQTLTISINAWKTDGKGEGGHGPGLHGGDYEGPCVAATGSADNTKITICHVPPGNPENAQTLTISINAWKTDGKGEGGHGPGLHGGDYEGPCVAATGTAMENTAPTCGLAVNDPCPIDNVLPAAKVWIPVAVKAAACVDWTFYHSDRTGNLNIFRLGAFANNATADANISKGTGINVLDMSPASSPDGQYVAFTSNRTGNWEIYIGAADGSTQQRVTYTTTAANLSPMWSPDGKSIVYETTRNGLRDIYVIDVTTGQETRLTDGASSNVNPFWSPDSQKILFQTNRDGLWQIYEVTLSSKAWKRLSQGQASDINPQYSPDGKQIVFRSFQAAETNNTVIYTMNADGSNRLAISDANGNTLNPSWSPDNTLIAYQSNLKGAGDIFVYEVSTRLTRQITDNTTLNSASTWHCKSTMLIYTSVVNGKPQLYQVAALPMNAKPVRAADSTQLTNDNASNNNPQGSPSIEDASHRTQEGRGAIPPK